MPFVKFCHGQKELKHKKILRESLLLSGLCVQNLIDPYTIREIYC